MKSKIVLVIFIVGAALRIALFWQAPLWYDENFSLILARLPLADMLAANAADVHPPLWYVIIWTVQHVFQTAPAWIIRVPSVLFSIATLGLFWRVVNLMTDKDQVQVLALTLMAVAPVQIYYAQEARMYALMEFLIVAAWLSILEKKWGYLAIEISALALTQNIGILYAVCLFAAGLMYDRRSWKPLTLAMITAAVLWLPWLSTMFSQMQWIYGRHWIPPITFGAALYNMAQMFWVAALNVRLEILGMILFFSWVMIGTAYAFIHRPIRLETTWILALLAFGPWLLEVIASVLWQPILLHRTLVGVTPFLYLLMAAPAEMILRTRISRLATVALIVPALVGWYATWWFAPSASLDDFSVAKQTIEANWQPGDAVYHMADTTIVNMWPYSTVETGHVYKMPDCAPVIGGLTQPTREAMGFPVEPLSNINASRVWIVTGETPFNPTCEMAEMISCKSDKYSATCLYLLQRKGDSNNSPLIH
jgi:hypothetical protein